MKENSFLVSGYEFYKLSKLSFCPRYQNKFYQIEENDFVFVNLDSFGELIKNLPKNKFNLITHNSDLRFTNQHLDAIKNSVKKIYAINCIVKECDLIKKIPLGFVDTFYKPHEIFSEIKNQKNLKSIFVYMNFSVNTNYNERNVCLENFINKKWVLKEQNLPYIEFYKQLSKSQYVISPEGTGIDCHRIYESLFLDCIPIIKSGVLDDFYEKLPLLIVKNWNDVTENDLNENYNFLFNKLKAWKDNNKNWYKAEYWLT